MMKKMLVLLLSLIMLAGVNTTALATENPTIRAGETLAVSMQADKDTDVLFAPEASGIYRLTSEAAEGVDPAVTVFAGDTMYADADDTADSLDFALQFYCAAGTQYVLQLGETSGAAATYNVTMIFVDSVENVTFSPVNGGYVHYENTDVYPAFAAGDAVTVTFGSGKVCRYVYQTALADFYCSETKTYISADFGSLPELTPVFDKSDGSFLYQAIFGFLNGNYVIDVTKGESPVAAIDYQPKSPMKVVKNVSGWTVNDSSGTGYFQYNVPVGTGDKLRVSYINGTEDVFTLTATDNGYAFVNADGHTPDEEYFFIDYLDCQEQKHWECGTNYFYVHYYGSQYQVPVLVINAGWFKESGKWYYYQNTDGKPATGWRKIGGKWYLFAYADGRMLTNWVKSGGKWYYFGTDGAMKSGWVKTGGKWYYFNASGAMVTGWQKIGGKWYFFNASGAMFTGWVKSGGKWYYMESSGAMATNKSLKIGKKTYKFNKSGVCLNP